MPTFNLQIDDVSYNGVTGHRSINAHVIEIIDDHTIISGAPETHGIDPLSLERLHGSLEKWLESVKVVMIARHQTRRAMDQELMGMRGKKI